MDRRDFLKAAMLSAAALALPGGVLAVDNALSAAAKGDKPNIIFILADDLGYGDVGCFGSDHYKTPKIDALAKSGIKFEQCYSAPLCGPSRCEIMTGRYPFHTGMISNQSAQALMPRTEIMMPKVLKPAGYVTAECGKWSQLPLEPGDWGFDEYFRFVGSGQYWSTQNPNYVVNGEKKVLKEGEYFPDLMHNFVVDFITKHKDQPFYIHYPMSHIHGQILKTPDTKPGTKDFYTDNIAYMDKLVGKLVDKLDELKLREKTVIVFVGDNGTAPMRADTSTVHGKRLSGQKGSLLEGGSRVPMIVSCPGMTPAGKSVDDLVDFTDYLPTFAELGGAKLPAGVTIDGHSFADRVKGKDGKPREWVYVELNGKWYVRDKRYKLTGTGDMYDLKNAPFEEIPVPADTKDAGAIASRKRLQALLDKLNPAAGNQKFKGGAAPKKRKRKAKATGAGGGGGLGALLGL